MIKTIQTILNFDISDDKKIDLIRTLLEENIISGICSNGTTGYPYPYGGNFTGVIPCTNVPAYNKEGSTKYFNNGTLQ